MRFPHPLLAFLLCAVLSAGAANADSEECNEPELPGATQAEASTGRTLVASATVPSSRGLLSSLEIFLHERAVDMSALDAEGMVAAMSDWFRYEPAPDGAVSDALVFRYGGWSEGCATGFKLSLLRRVVPRGGEGERMAGITLLFEPASLTGLAPASFVSTDSPSMEAFLGTIRASPAFKTLVRARPMSAMTESGALR